MLGIGVRYVSCHSVPFYAEEMDRHAIPPRGLPDVRQSPSVLGRKRESRSCTAPVRHISNVGDTVGVSVGWNQKHGPSASVSESVVDRYTLPPELLSHILNGVQQQVRAFTIGLARGLGHGRRAHAGEFPDPVQG